MFVPLILAQNKTSATYGEERKSVALLKCRSYIRYERLSKHRGKSKFGEPAIRFTSDIYTCRMQSGRVTV